MKINLIEKENKKEKNKLVTVIFLLLGEGEGIKNWLTSKSLPVKNKIKDGEQKMQKKKNQRIKQIIKKSEALINWSFRRCGEVCLPTRTKSYQKYLQ